MHTHMYTSGRVRRRRGGVEGKGRRYSIHKVNFAAEEEKEELFTTFINSCSGGQEHQGDAGGGEGMFSRGRRSGKGMFSRGRRSVSPQRRNCSRWWRGGESGSIMTHIHASMHAHTVFYTHTHTCTHANTHSRTHKDKLDAHKHTRSRICNRMHMHTSVS